MLSFKVDVRDYVRYSPMFNMNRCSFNALWFLTINGFGSTGETSFFEEVIQSAIFVSPVQIEARDDHNFTGRDGLLLKDTFKQAELCILSLAVKEGLVRLLQDGNLVLFRNKWVNWVGANTCLDVEAMFLEFSSQVSGFSVSLLVFFGFCFTHSCLAKVPGSPWYTF